MKDEENLAGIVCRTYTYYNKYDTLQLIFASKGFTEVVERLKYLQVAQTE